MRNFLKQIITKAIPNKLQDYFVENATKYASLTYSQEGEDILIDRIFAQKSNGFYIDIGAHHPKFISNTYFFYKKGWTGVNIDAMPGSMNAFNEMRPKDINLEIPISNKKEVLTYYSFDQAHLNGFIKDISAEREKIGWGKIIQTYKLTTEKLSNVLDKHMPPNQEIDFMSVDVEGLDLDVLQSNDWSRYQPKVIIIEDLDNLNIEQTNTSAIYNFLHAKGYKLHSKLHYSQIYIKP